MRTLTPRFNCRFPIRHACTALAGMHRNGSVSPNRKGLFAGAGRTYWLHSGRVALFVVLRALFPEGGRRIGVQAYTCVVVMEAIRQSGNIPVFLDVDETYTLCRASLLERIGECDALIVTHTFGRPAEMAEVRAIAGGRPIIEDCAHSLGSFYQGRPTGSFGVAAVFSFGFGKPISLGGGGVLRVNDERVGEKVEEAAAGFERPGRLKELRRIAECLACSWLHAPYIFDFLTAPLLKKANNTVDWTRDGEFSKTYGLRCIETLLDTCAGEFLHELKTRRQNAERLAAILYPRYRSHSPRNANIEANGYLFPLRARKAPKIVAFLRREGYEAARHFSKSVNIATAYGYEAGQCPFTERMVEEIFTVPCHQGMTEKRIEYLGLLLLRLAADFEEECYEQPIFSR